MRKKDKISKEIVTAAIVGNIETIKANVEESNVNNLDKDGRTLLHHSIISGHLSIVEYLISCKADLNIHDSLGWVPLHYAAQQYQVDIVKFLIKSGADVNAVDNYGNNVLWRAVFESKGRGEVIKILLENGGDLNMENNKRISPLQLVKTIANYDINQYLK